MPDQISNNVPSSEPKTIRPLFSPTLDFCRRWYPWIVGPLLIGLVSVSIAAGCDYATYLNRRLVEASPYAPIVILPIGFALFAYLVRRYFQGTQGSGIPQAIAAIDDPSPQKKHHLLSIRIIFGKGMMLIGGLAMGASIGREGPTVQIGASIMHAFYGHGHTITIAQRRTLVMVGGAAGIAAAFNTPLAGVMFAIEELSKKYAFNAHSPALLTVVLSGLVSLALVGHYTYFGSTSAFINMFADAHLIVICGIVGGVLGGIFSRLMIKMAFRPPSHLTNIITNHPVFFAGLCGTLVAVLALLTDSLVLGSGYEATRSTLESNGSMYSWYYGFAKFAATFLSSISGIPGGLFAPSLSVGAGIGDGLSGLFPTLGPHGVIVLLVMAAYLSGVTRAPLTALVITMEMTNGLHLLLPLAATVLIASGVSRLISKEPLYHVLAEKFSGPSQFTVDPVSVKVQSNQDTK